MVQGLSLHRRLPALLPTTHLLFLSTVHRSPQCTGRISAMLLPPSCPKNGGHHSASGVCLWDKVLSCVPRAQAIAVQDCPVRSFGVS